MAEIEMHTCDTHQRQRLQHQPLHFQIALDAAVPIQFGTDLQRLARAHQSGGLGMQYAARITQASHALAIEQMRIDTRHLRRDVGTQSQGTPAQLIDQLEAAQIHVFAVVDEQRFGIFQQGRRNQLISGATQQLKHIAAHAFDAPRLVRQHVLDIFRQQPIHYLIQ